MGTFPFNIARGRIVALAESIQNAVLPHDAFVWILLQSTGLEADGILQDRPTLAEILAVSTTTGGTNVEATFTGYSRLVHRAGIQATVDNVSNVTNVTDLTDPTWSPTSAQSLGKIIVCYDPDTTSGTDADLIPLRMDDFIGATPTSGAILYPISNIGYFHQST